MLSALVLTTLGVLAALIAVPVVLALGAVFLVLFLVLNLLLLPFRLLFWGIGGLVKAGVLFVMILAGGLVMAVLGVVGMALLLIPAIPILLIAGLVWLVWRALRPRPSTPALPA